MSKFFDFFQKKKFSIDVLEKMKDEISDYRTDIQNGLRENKSKLKRMIAKGLSPSPIAAMRYKRVQLLDKQMDGLIDTIDGMMFEVEFQEAIKAIQTISSDLYNDLNMFKIFDEVDNRMKEVMKIQIDYVKNMDKEIEKQDLWLKNLEEQTDDQRIELEKEFGYLGDELLAEFIMEDEELVKELPAEVKEKPIVKQIVAILDKE